MLSFAKIPLHTFCFLILTSLCFSRHIQPEGMTFTGSQFTYTQKLDHFNPIDKRSFSQRYWVSDEFYQAGQSPIFLYICPERTCIGFPGQGMFAYQLSQDTKALMLTLEHRYYGLSQPFGADSMKTKNLLYLTVEQALEDLASFLSWFKENSSYNIQDSQPWFVFGGSYGGALTSWFRYKYAHLTVGAWAASAVVNSILDFPQFDYQIYLSTSKSGPECPATIQNLTQFYEYQLYNTTPDVQQEFKAKFGENALKLSNDELLWFIADSFVTKVQYGGRVELCTFLSNNTNFDWLSNNTITYLTSFNDVRAYGSYFVGNEIFDPTTQDTIVRQWNYQVCSQLGWFQTPATDSQYIMRSTRLTLDFFQQFCNNAFGITSLPDTNAIDVEFGGVNLEATNIVTSNGCEDPWQWATKNATMGSITSVYINCDDCAHCVDFFAWNGDNVPTQLTEARATIESYVKSYLATTKFDDIIM